MIPLSETAEQERAEIILALSSLIAEITDEEIEYIAESDTMASARENQKQIAALRTVIFKRKCMMTEKHTWYPGEVLGLIADSGEEHLDRSFEIATGLLMIQAMGDDDSEGMMSWRWQEIGKAYWDTDPAFCPHLLRGFLWMAENVSEWDFMQDQDKVPPLPKAEEVAELLPTPPANAPTP
ncbi:MAG: hypothetical protein AAF666_06375 [Pseudomonadota bacterium]